ncbi:MAG TPA: LptF/LptG family permease [Vicinamibacterales bacterium]|nr:LptF/LptG family permease [Vicinamibacterales bacterium]
MKILDRYLVREIVLPFSLVLVGLTFVLMMPPILNQGEALIAKGVHWRVVVQVLVTLLPQALGVTIPMSLLLGILIGLGRVSADREFVALQACGVSLFRLLRPLTLLAALATAATLYIMIVALPDANQRFREITFNIVASQSEGDVKPRVFFTTFPRRVIYVRDIPQLGGWRDVFLADTTQQAQSDVYFAQAGRLIIDRQKRTVMLELERGTRHTTYVAKPDVDEISSFERLVLNMDADAVFPRTQIMKGDPEMTIAELRATIAENQKHGAPVASQLFYLQQKFAFPAACVVFTLIGLALGITNRKDGKLAGFVLGIGVIFVYYIVFYAFRGLAMSGRISASFAPWIANIVLGIAGVALVVWRAGSGDRPIRVSVPPLLRGLVSSRTDAAVGSPAVGPAQGRNGVVVVIRIPHIDWPRPQLLDLYVIRQYVGVIGVSFLALLGVFYISTFIDLVPHLMRGRATTATLMQYFYWQTPQYVYFIIPLTVLVGTLVTIGMLTKSSELIVMRACGVSLYRSAVPILIFGLVCSGVLFELEEHVLAVSNREAIRLNAILRNFPMQGFNLLDRRWLVGRNGDIYQYDLFDPQANRFTRFTMYRADAPTWRLTRVVYAAVVTRTDHHWLARNGWDRVFSAPPSRNTGSTKVAYTPFAERTLEFEPPEFFKAEEPDADRMNYGELKGYITLLQSSGSMNVVKYIVDLQRKIAFPFVSLIMTLLAIPFAVTTGRRGAMYGIGAGLVLALVYWTMLSVFGALGAGGWISPVLAAWAPNILFGTAAVYLLLTVRT